MPQGVLRQLTFGIDFGIRGQNDLQQSNNQVDLLKRNVSQSSGALAGLGTAAIAAGTKIKATFTSAIALVRRYRYYVYGTFAAVGAAIAGTTKAAGDFEYQLTRTGQVAEATSKELGMLKENAINLGIETAFTAKQAAEGQELLARSGFEVREIIETLPSVLDAAAIENLELSKAASIVGKTVRTMGYDVDQSRRTIDVLAKTSTSTQATVSSLGESLPQVAGSASRLGWEIEELSAALGLLADRGDSGSRAGTRLRGVIQSLTSPSSQAQSALKELDVDLWDEGRMKNLTGIIKEFESALEGMTDQEREARLGKIFSGRRAETFGKLLDAGSEDVTNFTAKLEDAGGTAETMAEKQLDTLHGSIQRLRGSINVAAIQIGEYFVPKATSAIDTVTGLINVFNDAPPATQKLTAGILGTLGVLVGLAAIIAIIEKPLAIMKGLFTAIGGILGVTAGQFLIIIGVVTALYLVFEDLWYSMEHGYDGVIAPLIDRMLDFMGVGKDFSEIWEEVKEGWDRGLKSMRRMTSGTFWSIYHTAGLITDGIYGLLTGDWEPVLEHWEGLKDSLKDVSDGFWNLFDVDSEELAQNFNEFFDNLSWNIEISIRNIKWKIIHWWRNIEWPSPKDWWDDTKKWFEDFEWPKLPEWDIDFEWPDVIGSLEDWWDDTKKWFEDFEWPKLPEWDIDFEWPDVIGNLEDWWDDTKKWADENLKFGKLFEGLKGAKDWFGGLFGGNNEPDKSKIQPQSGNNNDTNVKVETPTGDSSTVNRNRTSNQKIEQHIEIPIEITESENGEETAKKVREEVQNIFDRIMAQEGEGAL